MDSFPELVARYGGVSIFLFSFVENIGVPIPALPVFILAGALAAAGRLPFHTAIAGAVTGALLADLAWYLAGRWRGRGVLAALCRVTFNPDACVERAEFGFHRRQSATILIAKFLPGVNTIMPPLAGIVSLPIHRFLALDFLGSLLWAGTGLGLGWIFGSKMAAGAEIIHGAFGWIIVGGLAAYLAWRVAYRYYLVRRFSVPRLDPGEVHRKMEGGADLLVLDLRSDAAYAGSRLMIAGAVRVRPATFHRSARDLPRDREIVLYCT